MTDSISSNIQAVREDTARRISTVERKLDVFETKMDQVVTTVERASAKMDGHFVTKQEQELRTELLRRDIEASISIARNVNEQVEWVKRGVLSSLGGVFVLFLLKMLPVAGVLK